MRALRFLLRKEFLQIFRDRMILGMVFMLPMVQLLILSNAATFEVSAARLYVLDFDHTPMSRGVVSRLAASGRFIPTESSQSSELADDAMRDGRIELIVTIPAGFERDIVRDKRGPVQFIMNAEDGGAAGVMQSYAGRILAGYSREIGGEVNPMLASAGAKHELPPRRGQPLIEVRERGWFNENLEYLDYMVPGILVVLVTMVGTLLTAMNIVREKEAGTLDQLNVTPASRPTFIAAKLLPLWSLAMFDLIIGLLLAHYVLGVPVRGNPAIILFAAAIYLTAALGIGLWVSTIAETQQQAMFVTFAILMVYMLMSGLFTPVRGMPVWAQWIAQASPVMHFTVLIRAVLLKGATMMDVAKQLLVLSGIGIVVLSLAVRQYNKRAA